MDTLEYIEAYHTGSFSAEERSAFHERLATDPAFRQAYDDYILARQVSGTLAYAHAREKISRLRAQPSLTVAHRQSPARVLLRFAASLLFLVVCAFLYSQLRYSDTALANRHFQSAALTMRAPQSNGAAVLIDAGKYAEALTLLEQAPTDDLLSQSLRAETLTKLERFPEAIAVYRTLAADTQYFNHEGAAYALALLYLRSGDEVAARDLLNRIAGDDSHDYRFEARKLLVQMDRIWRQLVR